MAVSALRTELKARGVSYKGLKSQLAARLAKLLKAEAEKNEDAFKDSQSEPEADVQEDKKSEVRLKVMREINTSGHFIVD